MAKIVKGKYPFKEIKKLSKKKMREKAAKEQKKLLAKQDKELKIQCDCNHLDSKNNKSHFKKVKDSEGKISIDSVNYTPVYLYDSGSGSKSRTRYTLIDVEKAITDYENGESGSVSKSLYNTLKDELKSIKKHVGDEIN